MLTLNRYCRFSQVVLILLISAACLLDARKSLFINGSHSAWKTTHAALEEQLRFEAIDSVMSLASFLRMQGRTAHASHTIRVVILKNGLVGIFKTGEYHYAEVAAYRLSKQLGFHLVPPTVYRTIEGIPGSLQLYIDAPDLSSHSEPKKVLKKCGDEAIVMMKLFCYIAGQWDTHLGNQIVFSLAGNYYLALIDNSGIVHRSYSRYGGVQFVGRGEENREVITDMSQDFPYHEAIKVSKVDTELKNLFQSFLTPAHIRSISSTELTYIFWQHSLWIKWPSHKRGFTCFTNHYYRSTLVALSKLCRVHLEEAWSEYLQLNTRYVNELITLSLNRRDEILHHANTFGEIIED